MQTYTFLMYFSLRMSQSLVALASFLSLFTFELQSLIYVHPPLPPSGEAVTVWSRQVVAVPAASQVKRCSGREGAVGDGGFGPLSHPPQWSSFASPSFPVTIALHPETNRHEASGIKGQIKRTSQRIEYTSSRETHGATL